MKKLFTLLLCLCMLAGCGSNKYEELIELLDEGNYTQAVDYINNLAYEEAKNNGTIKTSNEHIKFLYGSWEYAGSNTEIETYDIQFKDNGKCIVNGKEYLWNITTETDTMLYLEILEGASKAYAFQLSYDETTEFYYSYFSVFNKDEDNYNNKGYYRNLDHYEIVELTTDNWLDYFEFYETTEFIKDSFGETTSCTYAAYYRLKEEYVTRLNYNYNNSPIAYEFKYENGKMDVIYSLEDETFELGEFEIRDSNPEGTSKSTMSSIHNPKGEYWYGFTVMNISPTVTVDRTYLNNYRNNIEMIRLQGNLMFWKGID